MIVVTGGGGYVAGHTIRQLTAGNTAGVITAVVRSERDFAKISRAGAVPIVGDVTDVESLEHAFEGADVIVHLAAVNRNHSKATMDAVNAQGTINVVKAAKHTGAKRLVTVVGLGADAAKPYALARTQGIGVDAIIRSGIPYTILEASVIFGEGDEFINTLAGLARIPPFMIVPGDGKSRFQPIAADDVAACVVQSATRADIVNRRLQICGSEVMTLEDIIDAILVELQLKRVKVHMPVTALRFAVWVMDKLLPKPPVTPSLLSQLGVDNIASDNATENVFGIRPMRLKDGIGYARAMTLGLMMRRSFGRVSYR